MTSIVAIWTELGIRRVGAGVERIGEFSMNGQMAEVPWYRIEMQNGAVFEVNSAYVIQVERQEIEE